MAIYNWQDIPNQLPEELDPGNLIAVFPLAATEQHGPHLPFSTDADIAAGSMISEPRYSQYSRLIPIQYLYSLCEVAVFFMIV